MAPANCRTCCVLLAPAVERDQAEQQLDGRGWAIHAVDAPLQAMAELCLLDRSRDSRRAWGHDAHDGDVALALVVVDPRSWHELDRLVRAARRYLPSASLWELAGGTMRPLGPQPQPGNEPEVTAPSMTEPAAPPPISPEEIAMLLEGNLREGSP